MTMSTSCNPALDAKQETRSQPFLYAEAVAAGGRNKTGSATIPGEGDPGAETNARREATARETGRREGEAQARAAGEKHLAQIRESVTAAIVGFAHERTQYFQQVETEVVQLALAIARKILHREAQLDPLLLAGMVRITLEKIESATKVVLRVHPQQVSECRSYFAQHMEASKVPEVVDDPAVKTDHCLIQTALGSTEIGMEVQLKEIEQGLFDLLAKRPANP
jgi:flagellar assembly protein FliH